MRSHLYEYAHYRSVQSGVPYRRECGGEDLPVAIAPLVPNRIPKHGEDRVETERYEVAPPEVVYSCTHEDQK